MTTKCLLAFFGFLILALAAPAPLPTAILKRNSILRPCESVAGLGHIVLDEPSVAVPAPSGSHTKRTAATTTTTKTERGKTRGDQRKIDHILNEVMELGELLDMGGEIGKDGNSWEHDIIGAWPARPKTPGDEAPVVGPDGLVGKRQEEGQDDAEFSDPETTDDEYGDVSVEAEVEGFSDPETTDDGLGDVPEDDDEDEEDMW